MKRIGMVGLLGLLAVAAAAPQAVPRSPRTPRASLLQQAADSQQIGIRWGASSPRSLVTGYAVSARAGSRLVSGSTPPGQLADSLWLARDTAATDWAVCVSALSARGPSPASCAYVTIPAIQRVGAPGVPEVFLIGDSVVTPDTLPEPPPDTTPPPPPPPPPPSGAASPHFAHARFAAIDYRIHYLAGAQQAAEYDQVAARYDVAIGGSVDAWKSRNPTVRQYVYDLLVGDETTDVGPMEAWLTANGYPVEKAYLHNAGQRASYHQWTADYYALNLGDPGFRAWRQYRTAQLLAPTAAGRRFDGIFFDVLGGGASGPAGVPATSTEYPTKAAYLTDLHALLKLTAQWSPSGTCLANTGNYTTAEDGAQADACRGTAMEFTNDIYSEIGYTMWPFVAARLAAGTTVILIPQRQGYLKNTARYDLNPGNYGTVAERVLMAEYANYLMLLDPARMDQLAVDFYLTGNADPATPHSMTWLAAFQFGLGAPTGARSVLASGTDGAGQPFQVFARAFTNALVVYRPMQNWARTKFGDATAMAVPLPAGSWRVLRSDGTQGPAVSSVTLRNGEALILVRG